MSDSYYHYWGSGSDALVEPDQPARPEAVDLPPTSRLSCRSVARLEGEPGIFMVGGTTEAVAETACNLCSVQTRCHIGRKPILADVLNVVRRRSCGLIW